MPKQSKGPFKDFPSKIRVMSQDWDVVYVKHISNDEHLLGACDLGERRIYIDKRQNIHTARETLLHECMHIMFRLLPIIKEDDEEEERMVLMISAFLMSFLRENADTPFWEE
jgi:hypothetical protein